jgi:ABC-2 type transport system ATP-binding protein/lipopolysaccharide transport system ATP-binding protein
MLLIDCKAVSKQFHRHTGGQLLRNHFLNWRAKTQETSFYALKDVSFQVSSGESVAIVGRNGAGKSTLLSLVAGLAPPDSGSLAVNGKVAALLQLGAGFHPELTGVENLLLNAALLGFTEQRTRDRLDEIVAFAELEEFIFEPLRTYSTGMSMRLAFSIAVNLDPDILIIDEILAVGDQRFQQKSFDKLLALRRAGKCIVAVSHANDLLNQLCDQAIWLDHGRVMAQGPIRQVLDDYLHADAQAAAAR